MIKVNRVYNSLGQKFWCFSSRYSSSFLLSLGIFALVIGLTQLAVAQESTSQASFNDELIRNAVGQLFCLIEGAFGALIMVVAGVMAIIAAAMGSYRASLSMLIVAVGAFILRALVSLFFGSNFAPYDRSISEACS